MPDRVSRGAPWANATSTFGPSLGSALDGTNIGAKASAGKQRHAMTGVAAEPPAPIDSVEVRALVATNRVEVEQLATIFDLYRVHYGELAGASQTARWLDANINSGRLEAFIATDGAEFLGFAVTMAVPASLRLGHFWQIRDLFVLPHHRRRGIGGALLDHVRAAALRAGALRLVLQTETDNASALGLYAAKGFTVVEGYRTLTLALEPDVLANSPLVST